MLNYFKNAYFNQWPVFLLLPVMLFPIFWFVATIVDWIFGDSSVLLRIQYDSKGKLLHEFLTDWLASLPVSIASVWLVLLPMYILFTIKECRIKQHPLLAGGLIGLITGLWLFKLSAPGVLIMSISGFSLGLGLIFIQWLFSIWSTDS